MQNYRNLIVWKKAHELVLEIYRVTVLFPADEKFGLVSQMRRSAASIPTNIAEGSARKSDADYARFVLMALGSAVELDYQLYLSHDLHYLAQEDYTSLSLNLDEISKMLNRFVQTLQSKS